MAPNPVVDHGQELPKPENQAIGFVDSKEKLDAVVRALKAAGYPESGIIVLFGEDGINLLQRLERTFNFGDGEGDVEEFAIKQLRAGHYAFGVNAEDRDSAVRIANLAQPLGAHSFSYFGTWVNERMTK